MTLAIDTIDAKLRAKSPLLAVPAFLAGIAIDQVAEARRGEQEKQRAKEKLKRSAAQELEVSEEELLSTSDEEKVEAEQM